MVKLNGSRIKGFFKGKIGEFKSERKKKKILKSIAKKERKKIEATGFVKRQIAVAKAREEAKTKQAVKLVKERVSKRASIYDDPMKAIFGSPKNPNVTTDVLSSLTGAGQTQTIKVIRVGGKKGKKGRRRVTTIKVPRSNINKVLEGLV